MELFESASGQFFWSLHCEIVLGMFVGAHVVPIGGGMHACEWDPELGVQAYLGFGDPCDAPPKAGGQQSPLEM